MGRYIENTKCTLRSKGAILDYVDRIFRESNERRNFEQFNQNWMTYTAQSPVDANDEKYIYRPIPSNYNRVDEIVPIVTIVHPWYPLPHISNDDVQNPKDYVT